MQISGWLSGRRSLLTIARVRALSNRTVFRSIRIQSELGWRPEVGYRAGLHRTVQWYRQTGQL
jgi:dTDP-D-glucose 4,6-dehydratase